MQDDGCRFIANLTSISKLGAGRVGSVRLMALPDGTSAALKQDFPGKNQQADFHREVRTQAMAGALAPLVLATCGPRYEILSELLPAPWIQELRPCRRLAHGPLQGLPTQLYQIRGEDARAVEGKGRSRSR